MYVTSVCAHVHVWLYNSTMLLQVVKYILLSLILSINNMYIHTPSGQHLLLCGGYSNVDTVVYIGTSQARGS